MIKRIGIAAAAAIALVASIGPAQASGIPSPSSAPTFTRQLSTHCVLGHCRQREVLRDPLFGSAVAVWWRHRDWQIPTPNGNAPGGAYADWSGWQLRRVDISL